MGFGTTARCRGGDGERGRVGSCAGNIHRTRRTEAHGGRVRSAVRAGGESGRQRHAASEASSRCHRNGGCVSRGCASFDGERRGGDREEGTDVYLGDKGADERRIRRLEGSARDWKIGGLGLTREVHIAGIVQGHCARNIAGPTVGFTAFDVGIGSVPAQVGRIDQRTARRIYLGHKRVVAIAAFGQELAPAR